MQIEARIDQNPEISQMITLWGQEGSRVIRGNLLVIPVEDSILYVEPLYLQAEKSEIPELTRVIVVYNNQVTLGETLDEALRLAIVNGDEPQENEGKRVESTSGLTLPTGTLQMVEDALSHYLAGQESLRRGDWAAYGKAQEKLEETLKKLKEAEDKKGHIN
jgi:hypothetical protein